MISPLSPDAGGSGRPRLLFDGFELRLDTGELFEGGSPVRLQPQPAKVLELLASRSGEVVTREEIRQLVWGESFLDLDASLNFCIKEIRRALGDSATAPRFIETAPKRGYRFLMPVRIEPEPDGGASKAVPPPSAAAGPRSWPRLGAIGLTVVLLGLLTFAIGGRLRPVPPEKRPETTPETRPKPSEPAQEAYLRGLYFLRHEQYEKAALNLQEALLLAPDYAPAYAALAQARLKLARPGRELDAVEAAARRALELDPRLVDAHVVLGRLLVNRRDWEGGGRELQQALALDPENAGAHHAYSLFLAALGRQDEAIAASERARELDPGSMLIGSDYAWLFYLDHRYPEAIRQARKTLELFPAAEGEETWGGRSWCFRTILLSAWKMGDRETAIAYARSMMEGAGIPREAVAGLDNLEDYWRGQDRYFREAFRQGRVGPTALAESATLLGDGDRAMGLLLQHCREPERMMLNVGVDPVFDPLHGDPRWPRVLDCLKLPADAPARRTGAPS